MVGDNIDHNPDVLGVGGVDEVLKVVGATEVAVEVLPVASPVAVVAAIDVINNGGNPDGVEAHTLDVVKVIGHALVVSTTVAAEVTAAVGAAVTASESIGEHLVNSALLPASSVCGLSSGGEEGGSEKSLVHSLSF